MRKGVYPYEHMDTWDRFTEPKLPTKEGFYSKLSDAHISDENYTHAQKVWATFGCKTLGNYNDLYCRNDVLLLADVFETFRNMCLRQYGLDPAHYYTSPGLSWDALLKKPGVELELLRYYDKHLFIEMGMCGSISMVSKRHVKANNPLVDGCDPEKPSSHILYLDANNLYGWAMSQPLPTGAFRWEEYCEQLAKTIADHPADDPEGFILEVDLEYPEDLHNAQNAYVGLRSKMYSILEAGGKNTKKAKGVKKNVVKKRIRHEQYKEALFEKQTFRHGMDVLRSERHHIYGQGVSHPLISSAGSQKNGVDTLAYGHRDAVLAGCRGAD